MFNSNELHYMYMIYMNSDVNHSGTIEKKDFELAVDVIT